MLPMYVITYFHNYACLSELGGPSGKSFRLVRACVRAVCMSSEIGVKKCGPALSLFPFPVARVPFSLEDSPAPQGPIQL